MMKEGNFMIQEINTTNTFTNLTDTKKTKNEAVSQDVVNSGDKISSAPSQTSSSGLTMPVDTVEISAEGQKALLQNQLTAQTESNSEDSTSSSSNVTSNLSQYTEAQLADLVANGTITQAQANQELAKRQEA